MRLFSVIVLSIVTSIAQAQSLGDSARSARSRAMGGVQVPFVKGAEALFVNPAALGTSPLLDIKIADVNVATNKFTFDNIEAFKDISADDPSSFNQFYGKQIWAQANGKTAVSIPYLSVGYLRNYELSLQLHNPAYPQFETYFLSDEAYYLGGSMALGPATYLGLAFKRVNRWGGSVQELTVGDASGVSNFDDIGNKFQNKGTGHGVDVALSTELSTPLKPTFALVWQDVGSTSFARTEGTEAPPTITQNLIFGGGVGFDLPGIDFLMGFEARHLLEPDIQIGKKLHVGAELSLPLVDVRAGYGQGYFSYGAGLNILIFHIDAVSYTEEMGVYPGQSGDARYMATISIDLSFDADFKFTDNNGKKRRLKQRR